MGQNYFIAITPIKINERYVQYITIFFKKMELLVLMPGKVNLRSQS